MPAYLVLGLILALAPASGEPVVQGSLSEDLKFLREYFQEQVLPEWKNEPRVIVDCSEWYHHLVYLPGRNLFVGTDEPVMVSVEPGSVRVEVRTEAGDKSIQVSRGASGPAVVSVSDINVGVTVLTGDCVCEVKVGGTVGGPPCCVAVLKKGGQVIAKESFELFLSDVEYWVYSDRVIMRVLGFRPEGDWPFYRKGEPLAVTVTFDLGGGRILVDRERVTDAALIERMRRASELLEGPIRGAVLRMGSGVEPLYTKFGVPRDDPLAQFIDRVIQLYQEGASEEELQRVMSERPNVEFLFPKRSEETPGLPVWVLPLLPVPLASRRGGA
ncbi:MAG: hypothetical protein ABGY09_06190 [Euryarchaeota archaeon]